VVSDGEELWEILIGDNGVDGEILLGGCLTCGAI